MWEMCVPSLSMDPPTCAQTWSPRGLEQASSNMMLQLQCSRPADVVRVLEEARADVQRLDNLPAGRYLPPTCRKPPSNKARNEGLLVSWLQAGQGGREGHERIRGGQTELVNSTPQTAATAAAAHEHAVLYVFVAGTPFPEPGRPDAEFPFALERHREAAATCCRPPCADVKIAAILKDG